MINRHESPNVDAGPQTYTDFVVAGSLELKIVVLI